MINFKPSLCLTLLFTLTLLDGPSLLAQEAAASASETVPETAISADVASLVDQVVAATQAERADTTVQQATDSVLALIKQAQGYAEAEPERFYREVEAMLRPLIDFNRFARNVMGPYYRQASEAQAARFAESFKWGLVRTYALALTQFKEGSVKILPPKRPSSKPDRAFVNQEIAVDGTAYNVVYRMRQREGHWKLENLIIEGVNIGLNYKSQFTNAMKDKKYAGEMDRVIDDWSRFVQAEEPGVAAD